MKTLLINKTKTTPKVLFKDGELLIEGRSLPENVNTFFEPLLLLLDEYVLNPCKITKVIFKFDYINSSTKRIMVSLCNRMNELHEKGEQVEMEFYCNKEDDLIMELYEDLSMLTLPEIRLIIIE